MFTSKKLTADSFTNLIAAGTIVTGSIHFTGVFLVRGVVNGNVIADLNDAKSDNCVHVAPTGEVNSEAIQATNVIIEGKATSKKIWAERKIRISSTSNIKGATIFYRELEIEPGAVLDNCQLKHLDHSSEGEII